MTFDSAFQSALRTQGAILSDDEIKRAEFVARSVAVAMLEEAAHNIDVIVCKNCFAMSDCDGLAAGEVSAKLVRAIIRQVQGEGNG